MLEQIPGLIIRYTEDEDEAHLREWLNDPDVRCWFPMQEPIEVEDTVQRWMGFHSYKCSLTAVKDDIPCGLATLYLMPYKKLAHQCQFGMIVGKGYRQKGIGTVLLNNLIHLAKEYFKIELLHLEVYQDNPAIRLYKRFGFRQFGIQKKWIKDDGRFLGRIFMEREL